jgi:hypothetical protein
MKDAPLKILLSLCRCARLDSVGRLKTILDRSDPQDMSLRRHLLELSLRQEERLRELERLDAKVSLPLSWRPDETKTRRLLKRFFPSVSQGLGSGPMNREAAMHYVERLEEENARFYHALASRAPDDDSRGFFIREAQVEESQLKHNRQVLL